MAEEQAGRAMARRESRRPIERRKEAALLMGGVEMKLVSCVTKVVMKA